MTDINVHTASYFEVIARITVTEDDGTSRRKRMVASVEAASFTEAESAGTEYFSPEGEDAEIVNINPVPYRSVYVSRECGGWFRVKVKFIIVDERTGAQKNSYAVHLVQADSTQQAQRIITDSLRDSVVDYEIAAVAETPVCEVVFHTSRHGGDE